MNNLKLLFLTFFSLFFISSSADTKKPTKRKSGKIGIGLSPLINGSRSTTLRNGFDYTVTTFRFAPIFDLSYHFSESTVGHVGLGRLSDKSTTTQSNNTNTSTDKIKSTIIQASIWKILNITPESPKPLDLGIGIFGIFTTGTNNYSSSFSTPTGTQTNTGSEKVKSIAVSLGIRPEWFIADFISLHTQIGVGISILNEDNSSFSEGGVNVQLIQAADLLGQAGFTFYF